MVERGKWLPRERKDNNVTSMSSIIFFDFVYFLKIFSDKKTNNMNKGTTLESFQALLNNIVVPEKA